MDYRKRVTSIAKYLILAACLVLVVKYSEGIFGELKGVFSAVLPLISGLAVAYVLNILMKKLEKVYFPKSKNKFVIKSRRAVCILLSLLLILAIIIIIALIVIPQLVNAISVIASGIPGTLNNIKKFIEASSDKSEIIGKALATLHIDIDGIIKNAISFASGVLGGLMNSTLLFVASFTSGLLNFIIILTFAIYVLANKEKLAAQIRKVMKAFLKDKSIEKVNYVADVTNTAFSSFIAGQCIEAIILGGLCTLGMFIFRFPYAATVGAFISATSLIPILGAYLGAALGAFMILTISPIKALLFLLFITILQQLENNLIYPKVVGSSIGLPGIWVFAAITIGGGLGGVMGMLLSVPIAASIYKLLTDKVNSKLASGEEPLEAEENLETEEKQ
ncbi:AI-2E family transporter [Clostridium swellfunianum]|uniref:AI-2E family transporter n=1 Tax=Clostridium swellfunianum TaxID=1367462 RepID=UPI00202E6D07|nr:AI-2E family transporter [Clostridium swellfunianum]MCM0650214.1 AI-2E family transporter [Clostridium swellfunianum]